jgi:hypothetical protein
MVLSVRSQIRQITECFIHQSGLFKICHDTRYCIDEFFNLGLKIKLYETKQNQKNQNPIQLDWRLDVTYLDIPCYINNLHAIRQT